MKKEIEVLMRKLAGGTEYPASFFISEGSLEVIFPGQSILVIHGILWNDQAVLIL